MNRVGAPVVDQGETVGEDRLALPSDLSRQSIVLAWSNAAPHWTLEDAYRAACSGTSAGGVRRSGFHSPSSSFVFRMASRTFAGFVIPMNLISIPPVPAEPI